MMGAVEHTKAFPGRADSLVKVRRWVAARLAGAPSTDCAVLAASELAANALRWSHSRDPHHYLLRTVVTPLNGAAIYVADRGPRGGYVARGDEGGRGLRIVAAIAEAWGIARPGCGAWTGAAAGEPHDAGRLAADWGGCVWFRIAWAARPPTEPPPPPPSGATWLNVMTRAASHCECAGVCGRKHRCPAEHAPGRPLRLVPVWRASSTAAAHLPDAALVALCADCAQGAARATSAPTTNETALFDATPTISRR